MVRAFVAVIAGFMVWSLIWLASGAIAQGVAPAAFSEDGLTASPAVLAALLGASMVCSFLSGLAAAKIAPQQRKGAALALGLVLLAVGVAVQGQVWNAMPLWYHVPFLMLLVPMTLLGSAVPGGRGPAMRPSAA